MKIARAGAALELRGSTLVAMRREWTQEKRWWYALDLCLHAGGVAYEILLYRDDYDGTSVLCEARHPEAIPRLEAALGDWLEGFFVCPTRRF
ncbi:hypothetical protein DB30_02046 [Enhygromyxa salina]|uniref:Uncharacterized protein n=1 Tax=Enhygromyxa salina TaxID=215803 RepID=A0A0C2CLI1_9BACT|nr:hypothetical protein [Enhygromyxa salina]KIG12101.1 hypothetical protein DB30_02046 [Enhygromyxa salina]